MLEVEGKGETASSTSSSAREMSVVISSPALAGAGTLVSLRPHERTLCEIAQKAPE